MRKKKKCRYASSQIPSSIKKVVRRRWGKKGLVKTGKLECGVSNELLRDRVLD